jgi:WD40 repeat protein
LPNDGLRWNACLQTLEVSTIPNDWVNAITFSPDGNTLASASKDGTIRLWDLPIGNEKQRLEGYSSPVNALAFSPDGKILVSASDDSTIRLWDLTTGDERQRLEGHRD